MVRAGSMNAISDFQKSLSSAISDLRDCGAVNVRKQGAMDVSAWLNSGLGKSGKTKGGLAKAMGVRASAVTELLAGVRQLRVSEIVPAATYLEIDPPTFCAAIGKGCSGQLRGGAVC